MSKSLRFPPNLSVMTLSPEMNDQSRSPWALFFLTYPRKKSTPHTVSPAHRREPRRMLVVRATAASGFVVVVVLDLFFSFSFFLRKHCSLEKYRSTGFVQMQKDLERKKSK